MLWRRQWLPTPVFLPGKSHGAWWAAVHGPAESAGTGSPYRMQWQLIWIGRCPKSYVLCNYYVPLILASVAILLTPLNSIVGACSAIQLSLTLWDSMDCSPPGSSVHEIFQARILEWVAMLSSRGSSQHRDRTCVSCISYIGRQILYQLSCLVQHKVICVSSWVCFSHVEKYSTISFGLNNSSFLSHL